MQKFVLSTIMGLEKIAKREIENCGGKIEEVTDRLITFSGTMETMARVNLWSRVGNKVYMLMEQVETVDNFDTLYDTITAIEWKQVYQPGFQISIKSSSQRSQLDSAPAIQKIAKKAIIDSLTNKSGEFLNEDTDKPKMDILILLVNNTLRVMLDTSGAALHMRGYRSEAGEAPIKENLAAALVLLSNWKFKTNLYDPFCGSGTIGIEAAMIARNIAPGLKRGFSCVELGLISGETMNTLRDEAKAKQYSGNYNIILSDNDTDMVIMAKENAHRAGVADTIVFKHLDFFDFLEQPETAGTMVSNPPYGERLEVDDIHSLYKNIDKFFRIHPNCGGGVITSYLEFDSCINLNNYKKRKLYNGGEKCYFYGRV